MRMETTETSGAGPALPAGLSRTALAEMLPRLLPRLHALARRYVRDVEDAHDVVQNACEKALRHAAAFRGDASAETWLHRIVINEALMWLRRRRSRPLADTAPPEDLLPDPAPPPDLALDAERARRRVQRALVTLTPRQRRVIERCALHGDAYQALVAESGESVVALKMRAFRARRQLARVLREE
jgi:RNA polymerase sigma-70 factor (ECF subfamily)